LLLIFLGFQAMLTQATLVYASPERFLSRLEQAPPASISFDTILISWSNQDLFVCGLLQVKSGCVLESPDQKTRGFMVRIALPWWFSNHAHQVFGEIPVRI
jgi:hypothetical protein